MAQGFDPGLGEQGDNPVNHLLRVAADPLGVLRRRWPWMLVALVLGVLGTGVFVALLEPSYQARARVLISSQQIPEDFVRSTVREDSLENLNAMVGEILTQHNLSALIQRHGLYPELAANTERAAVVGRMRGAIDISPDTDVNFGRRSASQIFKISFTYGEPVGAAMIANELAGLFVEVSIANRNRQARYTTEFLRRELDRAEAELREMDREITEFNQEHRGELPGDLEPTLRKLERLEAQRQSLRSQLAETDERILRIQSAEAPLGDLGPEEELMGLRRELMRELGIHTEEHPNVTALKERIALLEASLGDQAPQLAVSDTSRASQVASQQRERLRIEEQLALTAGQIRELDARVDRIPAREEELRALDERAEVLRENYLEFLRKVQDAELAETLESNQQGPRVTILDRANQPSSPTQPPIVYLALGLLASIAIGLGVGVLFELLDPVVLAVDQLEKLIDVAPLGSMPRL